ncbi:transposase [Collimonas humicola]|uniref:transposase n=1 Tax=Collimonas humicola TaxID=2825886 RepID=UPI001B8B8EBF|nr:transposase [Collimonas humicola]
MILRDDQWEKLEPLLLGRPGAPGASGRNNRLFIEAVLLHVSARCCWRELPSKFGAWNAIYMRFRRWGQSGRWHQIVQDLHGEKELRAAMEKVAKYADQQTESAVRRKTRRAEREIYAASVTPFRKGAEQNRESEADVNWLSLVGAA